MSSGKLTMRMPCATIVTLAIFGATLPGQDADTILLKNDDRKYAIVSQIQDPAEAAAFETILRATESASRYEAAKAFLRAYPQSWLLPQVYDAAARSAIDLEKYDDAVADGRFSLRLLPENPSLLVLLANIEAQRNLFGQAMKDANDALEYVDEIERPPGTTQDNWNVLSRQLKASAYFARARVEVSRAPVTGTSTPASLKNALDDLDTAAAWNDEDAELFYLRAIVELRLDQKSAAASDLAFVFRSTHPLREKAKGILLVLANQSAKGTSLEAFLKGLPPRKADAIPGASQQTTYPQVLKEGYAGPEACQSCHPRQYSTWRGTGMARMLQPYSPENIAGDFSSGSQYSEGPDVIRIGSAQRPYFEFWTLGKWQRFYVDFTIGSKWQQGYATQLPDGRLQVFPIEYNLVRKQWINYWKMIDPPGSPRAIVRDFPGFTVATNYQQNCAICHTSQLKANIASPNSIQHAVYLQPGVDCEMCHGPSAWHIEQARKKAISDPDPRRPPFDFQKANNRDAVRVCAQCHRQSSVREIGKGGEMNYAAEGSFVPATWLRSYDAFSRKAFYKDGRFRETTFIVEAFTRSACYLRGTAQCASCHSPHLADFENNRTSLKHSANPNEMCLQCHSEYRNRIVEHTHHTSGSEASQCVSCHMPRIANALLFTARSHEIEIPSADLTERFGQLESPNVCLACHSEKNTGWAKEQLASWRH